MFPPRGEATAGSGSTQELFPELLQLGAPLRFWMLSDLPVEQLESGREIAGPHQTPNDAQQLTHGVTRMG